MAAAMVVTPALLSGCVAIDAVHLITIAVDSRIHAIARSGVYPVEGQKVYYLEFDERRPMWAEKCNYDGIVVEYAKNWDTLGDHGQVTFRAKPNEPHGYAILIYQERCPNKPARDMLSTSEGTHIPYRGKLPFVNAGQGFNVGDYFSRALENRPKWMSQVIATVQAEAVARDTQVRVTLCPRPFQRRLNNLTKRYGDFGERTA